MEAYINIALIFIVIVAFSVFVANKVKKNRESMEEKDINVDDKTYTLDMMIQFIKKRLDEITKINLYDIGLSEEELDNYDNTIALISQKDINIRNFKRFLNSMFSKNFMAEHYLYKLDLLVLDYIQFFNLELYIIIYQNKKYFVSFHIEDINYHINKKKWITEKKYFFDVFSPF